MADAMGGEDSEHYAKFKQLCCQAYNWLRKSANLILNLLRSIHVVWNMWLSLCDLLFPFDSTPWFWLFPLWDSLMGDAGIEDISQRSTLPKVLLKVSEKFRWAVLSCDIWVSDIWGLWFHCCCLFRLDLSDEQAEQYFLGLVTETMNAMAPRIKEQLHKKKSKLTLLYIIRNISL